jgi:chemosensory pili system protein ChpA (sensor histidine kinase/response regulator)
MSNLIDHTLQFFYEEAEEHLMVLEKGLLGLEENSQPTPETIEELFRTAHTLKGAAGLVKQRTISQVAHRLEDSLEVLHEEEQVLTVSKVNDLLGVIDYIRRLLFAAVKGQPEPTVASDEKNHLLQSLGDELGQNVSSPAPADNSGTKPGKTNQQRTADRRVKGSSNVKVGTDQLELMMNLLGEITITKNHMAAQISSLQHMKQNIDFAGNRLFNEVDQFSERYSYALPGQVKYTDNLISEFQELEFDRYDELNLFTRKLEEITSDINESMTTMNDFFSQFTGDIETFDSMIQQLKERISSARTVQVGDLFQRFSQTIRELSRTTGKELQLLVKGGHTQVDREIFDRLYPPLLHIIRNAASHGIESLAERKALGKPAKGTIRLAAERRGSTLELTITDDGRGIQLDKIRNRAEAKGFLEPGADVTDQDLIQMVFRSGFSTFKSADAHAGRGIGMNVVMDNLAALNGTVEIASEADHGTTVSMNLPLSLVIINVIQFRLGEQAFVIPANLVDEILNLPSSTEIPAEVEVQDKMIPVIDLNAIFGITRKSPKIRFALVTHCAGRPVALLVEEVLSQEETILRSFGSFLKNLPHISGTSISGDGTLRLVLNPNRILPDTPATQPREGLESVPVESKLRILVVDDSLSVRKHAGFILENNGIDVITANNGIEALDAIDQGQFDFIITDLEMPLMHGYELLGELQRRRLLEETPAAVLSSRASQVHQDKARDLGACDYLVKPFDEESLMALVRKHLNAIG